MGAPTCRVCITLALLAAASAMLAWLVPDHWLSFDFLKAQQADLTRRFVEQPWQTAGLYMAVYVLGAVLLIPSAAMLSIAAGAIFGPLWGIPLVLVSATLGATLAFLAARYLGRDLIRERLGDRLDAFNHGIQLEGGFYLFALRLIAICPYVLINPAMGLTPMPLRTFVWVSFVGMIPVMSLYVNAGTRLGQVGSPADLFSAEVLVSFALLGLVPLLARHGFKLWRRRRVDHV